MERQRGQKSQRSACDHFRTVSCLLQSTKQGDIIHTSLTSLLSVHAADVTASVHCTVRLIVNNHEVCVYVNMT